jgi:hypothetical protein
MTDPSGYAKTLALPAARPRSSMAARYGSTCGRVAFNTISCLSVAHWKNARRSCRYASRVRPL